MKLFLLFFFFTSAVFASFDNISHRYLMPGDFYNKLLYLFPNADRTQVSGTVPGQTVTFSLLSGECVRNSNENNAFVQFGSTSPTTGEPQSAAPDMTTVNSLVKCGQKIIETELSILSTTANLTSSSNDGLLAKDTLARIFPVYKSVYTKTPEQFAVLLISDVDFKDPVLFVHTVHLIHMMLGPDQVIAEYGQAKSAEEIAKSFIAESLRKNKKLSLSAYTTWILTNLIIREEFLSF